MRQIDVSEAMKFLYPQPLAFLSASSPGGERNAMAVGWLMQASFEPPILAVAVSPKNYTHRLIEQTQQFTISLAGQGQTDLINKVGSVSGSGSDKLDELGIKAEAGPYTGCALIEGAAAHFECRLDRQLSVGDHTVFFGQIVAAWVPEAPVRKIDNFGESRYAPAEPAV